VPDEPIGDPVLDALWGRVLEGWSDDARHAMLIEHALRTQALPEVAGRYRALLGDPEKGAVAKKKLDAVVVAATQMLFATRTPRPGRVPLPITATALAVCALLLGWLFLALYGRR